MMMRMMRMKVLVLKEIFLLLEVEEDEVVILIL
jgi:hypothetical protein